MILADKIINLRKKLGISQEQLAEQLGVSRQSVSKWESMQSMPDTAKIIQLAEIFGVSTDYLLKDDIEEVEQHFLKETSKESSAIEVSIEEANAFLTANETRAEKVSLGVFFNGIASMFLIFMLYLSKSVFKNFDIKIATLTGIILMFASVTYGVFLIVSSNNKMKKYKYIEEKEIDTAYSVDEELKEKREQYEKTHAVLSVTGISLCILSGAVVVVTALMNKEWIMPGICIMHLTLAVGVYNLIRTSIIMRGYSKLLQSEKIYRKVRA